MDELLLELLNALDVIAETHEEIYDTVCREKMGEPIYYLFLSPTPGYEMPNDFGLYDESANCEVKDALSRYVSDAIKMAVDQGLTSFHQRLAAFQNIEVCSEHAGNYYDDYFGWMNPKDFDEPDE